MTAQVITWLILIAGWYLVHSLSVQRDKWNAARVYIKEIAAQVRNLAEDGIKYHSSTDRDLALEDSILWQFDMLSSQFKALKEVYSVDVKISDLHDAITEENFLTNRFVSQSLQPPVQSNILLKVNTATQKVLGDLYVLALEMDNQGLLALFFDVYNKIKVHLPR